MIWHFVFPRALPWTAHQPGYMAAADGGHGQWWLTDQGQGDKQAPCSAPAIDFSSEVSAWYGSSQGRPATKARASSLEREMQEKTMLSSWPVKIRDMIHALKVCDTMATKGTEESYVFFFLFTCNSCFCFFVSSGNVFFLVIELLWECFELWKLDCTAWIQLQLLKNRDDRTFIISHWNW